MSFALWAIPAAITIMGLIAITIAAARLAEEAGRLKLVMLRVSELRPEVHALASEARALQANRPGGPRR